MRVSSAILFFLLLAGLGGAVEPVAAPTVEIGEPKGGWGR